MVNILCAFVCFNVFILGNILYVLILYLRLGVFYLHVYNLYIINSINQSIIHLSDQCYLMLCCRAYRG